MCLEGGERVCDTNFITYNIIVASSFIGGQKVLYLVRGFAKKLSQLNIIIHQPE